MSMQEKSSNLAGAIHAAGKPLEPEITEAPIVALFNVIVAALAGMGFVLMVGTWHDALTYMPKQEIVVIYDCRFNLGSSILSGPCTIAGKWE